MVRSYRPGYVAVSNQEARVQKVCGGGGGDVAVHVVDRAEEVANSHPVASRSTTKNTVEEVVVRWWLACVEGLQPVSARALLDQGR